jgi:hypothetical protein
MVYYAGDRESAFIVDEVPNLILPSEIPEEHLIEVCAKWFGLDEMVEEPSKGGSDSSSGDDLARIESDSESYFPPWSSLVHLNGCLGTSDSPFLVSDSRISNIAEWVPFDQYDDSVMGCYGGYAIVNCNPESPEYNQVATLIFDNHGRVAVDMAEMLLGEYLEARAQHQAPDAGDDAVQFGFSCNVCHSRDFRGQRWNCSKCEVWDLCGECYIKRGTDGHCGDANSLVEAEAPKIHFIEHLRRKLGQGFYYG